MSMKLEKGNFQMKIIKTIEEMKIYSEEQRQSGKVIGFVPTMGYLHEGHISLLERSKKECDITILSIFVNPTQFAPNEDLNKYPRDLERDTELAILTGVNAVFLPEVKEMYPENYSTYVNVEGLTEGLCAKSRPTHFKGVATVVTKLFNITKARKAYFGQKDAQQLLVIKRMVEDLNMDVEIITCKIIREKDGIAKSSRNMYLSMDQRKEAVVLSKSLDEAKRMIEQGERNANIIKKKIQEMMQESKEADVDYIEIVDANSLKAIEEINGKVLIALAVKFGSTRLIDNVIVEVM